MSEPFPPPPEANPNPNPNPVPAPEIPKTPTPPAGPPISEWDVDDLKVALDSVRQNLAITIVGLIMVLTSVSVLLFYQVSFINAQVREMGKDQRQMAQFLENHRTNGAPYYARFIEEMSRFAQTHPDFARILAKYPRFQVPEPPPGVARPLLPGIDTPAQ